jgi:proteic killer suppression protein
MPLDVVFREQGLYELATDKNAKSGFPQAIKKEFRLRIQQIMSAVDAHDLYSLTSLHVEKLERDKSHQHSIRLNDQWRLIVEFEDEASKKRIVIAVIENYH